MQWYFIITFIWFKWIFAVNFVSWRLCKLNFCSNPFVAMELKSFSTRMFIFWSNCNRKSCDFGWAHYFSHEKNEKCLQSSFHEQKIKTGFEENKWIKPLSPKVKYWLFAFHFLNRPHTEMKWFCRKYAVIPSQQLNIDEIQQHKNMFGGHFLWIFFCSIFTAFLSILFSMQKFYCAFFVNLCH